VSATASAVATQLAAATSHGRSLGSHRHELARRGEHAQLAERVLGGVEDELDALALRAEGVGELGGHRDRGRGRGTGSDLRGDLAQHRGQRLEVAPDLERARDDAQPVVVEPGRLGVRAADVHC
jgi:hypothetical protein